MVISTPIQAASIGMADSLILMVLALVVFGPRRLPQIGRQIGKLMYEFRKASNDFKFQMEEELRVAEEADRRKREEATRQQTQQTLTEAQKAAELAQSAAATALNAAAEIKAAQLATAEVSSEPVAEAAQETAPAEPELRIQPPSSGEQIAANRPGHTASEPEFPQNAENNPQTGMKAESASEERPATESAAHHD